MRLLLHVGSTKTGSSALQATLFQQRAALSEAGTLYSDKGTASSAHHLLAAAVHPNAWRLHTDALPQDRLAYFRETARAIRAEAAEKGCETIVISSEYLWSVFREEIYREVKDAFEDAAVEIVAYLRRPDHWAVSSYLQAVKSGAQEDFEAWLEPRLQRQASGLFFFPVLEGWQRGVAAERVHVIVYERVAKRNVLAAFLDATGIAGVDREAPPRRVNPSPDAEGVRKLLELNRSAVPEEEKRQRRQEIMRAHVLRGNGTPFTVDDRTRLAILQATMPSNRQIRGRFTDDPDRPLFTEPWPKVAPPSDPPAAASPPASAAAKRVAGGKA